MRASAVSRAPTTDLPDGTFDNFAEWLAKGSRSTANGMIRCEDSRGRQLGTYSDFMMARDNKTFPVSFWRVRPRK